MSRVKTHYDNLKVSRNAPIEVIRSAYRALSSKYHPDKNPGNAQAVRIMQLINQAYDVLSDPEKRRRHDEWIERMEAANAKPTATPDGDARTANARKRTRDSSVRKRVSKLGGLSLILLLAMAGLYLLGSSETREPSSDRESRASQDVDDGMSDYLSWDEVVAKPGYDDFSDKERARLKEIYFDKAIAPTIDQTDPEALKAKRAEFFASSGEPPTPSAEPQAPAAATEPAPKPAQAKTSSQDVSDFLPWDEITAKPGYSKLSPKTRERMQALYFEHAIVPTLDTSDPKAVEAKRAEFFANAPLEPKKGDSGVPDYTRAPNGSAWPRAASYVKGYPVLNTQGHSSVTIDNSANSSAVFVKLVSLRGADATPVRHFFVPESGRFTLKDVSPGEYDIRYRDLGNGSLSRSEAFKVTETPTRDGVQYSILTITIYKVLDGNMETYSLSEDGFL